MHKIIVISNYTIAFTALRREFCLRVHAGDASEFRRQRGQNCHGQWLEKRATQEMFNAYIILFATEQGIYFKPQFEKLVNHLTGIALAVVTLATDHGGFTK
ncbi:hypothetical protein JCGZ_05183 [Jatropha curcas]|uniref:Uncharacterized protein n=1 Tax=Jatropha curcas TaxID=180498 RepID=A0A067KQA7_JATCU|nr:hypothetical protein JCGZ_05183 [Jatropha curcas]